jgi:hypothetical protein
MPIPRFVAAALIVLLSSVVSPASASGDAVPPSYTAEPDPTKIAEAWFHTMYGFDALMAFESKHGKQHTHFQVARRWRDGRAEMLFDVLEPEQFNKFAALLLHNTDSADDLFLYMPSVPNAPVLGRRVRRLPATAAEGQVFLQRVSLGDMRPITYGELDYTLVEGEQVSGEQCWIIEGRPRHLGLSFDKIVLAISQKSGMALRSEFYQDGRLTRRVSIDPEDIGDFGDRKIPTRQTIEVPHMDGTTELTLKNIMLDPTLPDRLFSHQNLKVQRFPLF